jgi:thioredoxin reductase
MSTEPKDPGVSDLIIIGGGPTGLFAAFYAGLRGMSVKIVDSLGALGGQLTTLYPEKYIFDVGGFPKILAKDLVKNLVEQCEQFHPKVCLGERVDKLDQGSDKIFSLQTSKATHRAKTVLIAAGVGAFSPKTLPLENAVHYEGNGLHYFVTMLEVMRGKRILIVGGGDSAVDWANTLSPLAASITLIHRRDQFRAHEEAVAQMKRGTTKILTFHELRSIDGDGLIEKAVVYDNRSNAEQTIEIDALLVNIGFHSALGPIAEWGLEIEDGSVKVDQTMQTNRPGIFAAGDIATFPGKLKLIATGFGEACTAVNFAKHHIDPHAKVFPGHSSNMKL